MEKVQQKQINTLVEILKQKGVTHAIISPGSRNAPLTQALVAQKGISTYSIVDERSAGYYALGMAMALKMPVALVCTSGTAAVNYAPAITEAFYQQIPLIAITADRPKEKINQREGQAIQQMGIFGKHVKYEVELPQLPLDEDAIRYSQQLMMEAINLAMTYPQAPVHINVPLKEPLYVQTEAVFPILSIQLWKTTVLLPQETLNNLSEQWNATQKIMILVGTLPPNSFLNEKIAALAEFENVVVLTEKNANLPAKNLHHHIDRLLNVMPDDAKNDYQPDLLITIGKDVVSKKIKRFLQQKSHKKHWHIEETTQHINTYEHLTDVIPVAPETFFQQMENQLQSVSSDYAKKWNLLEERAEEKHQQFCENVAWSDFSFYHTFFKHIPNDSVLHFGNSTPIRYAQLFSTPNQCEYYANRGTSGIDGSVSTAAGFAMQNAKINTLIVGDISFFYDSNGLWNKHLPNNLKIIVINNQGGNIFRIIDGPSTTQAFTSYFETQQTLNIEQMAKVFNLPYYKINEQKDVTTVISKAYQPHDSAVIIEVVTSGVESSAILTSYFNYLKP